MGITKDWVNVVVPAVLGEMWHNWVEHGQQGNHEAHQNEWVGLSSLGNQVIFLYAQKLKETEFEDILVLDLIVILSCVGDGAVDSIFKDVIPEIKVCSIVSKIKLAVWNSLLNILLNPLLKS